ncbi:MULTISPECIES: Gfo/Idh/MocA family oxidoreductase [Microcella]|uniref:Gfo/Idh/MocA family protein n=1 Tax=Microcella TaxID=337004 RepID=UPI0015CF47AC|nr:MULTISPECIES: Gfo/Idh/MocA family oxidoreductase [Microcella]QOD94637.1 Gfo/Idh/MocA family oxidoreductase [Chryseoglobus sp. 28M-23]
MSNGAPIRTGIIGFGLAGRVFHAPFLATNPAFTIAAIATSSEERAAQATAAHPGAQIMSTDALLALASAGDLDLVVLASPPHVHREQAITALEGGAAVVIDKPFAPSVADAEAIIAAADAAQRPLTVFQNRRWDGDYLTVARLLERGALGTVHRFVSTFERFGAPKRDQWQGQITPAQGGGILFDLGSHLVDQALTLFGPATLEVAELRAVREGLGSEDDAFLSLRHESGVRSHLTMSRVAAQSGPRFRVLGDESGYSVYGLDGQEPALKVGRWPGSEGYGETPSAQWGLLGVDNGEQPLVPVPTEAGAYPRFYEQVAASILDGASVPVDPRSALETVRIIEQAHAQSAS